MLKAFSYIITRGTGRKTAREKKDIEKKPRKGEKGYKTPKSE